MYGKVIFFRSRNNPKRFRSLNILTESLQYHELKFIFAKILKIYGKV